MVGLKDYLKEKGYTSDYYRFDSLFTKWEDNYELCVDIFENKWFIYCDEKVENQKQIDNLIKAFNTLQEDKKGWEKYE